MLTNLNTPITNSSGDTNYDFAIIGAGAAGITLARKLSLRGHTVALMEAGDYEFSGESQEVYEAQVVGDPYFQLDVSRLRFFGGATNHWGGMCRTFEAIDFQRGYLGPEFEWPIIKSDIDKYIQEASNILEIPLIEDDQVIENSNLREIAFKLSPRNLKREVPVNFRDKYFKDLVKDKNIHVFVNTNLTDITVDAGKINTAFFEGFSGNKISIKATKYIFCMGGIENSRYLLFFKKKYGNKFFSGSLPLGKYWMEHPHADLGETVIKKSKNIDMYRYFAVKESIQKELSILNCGLRVHFHKRAESKKMIADIICLAPKLGKKLLKMANHDLVCGATFSAAWEQAPNKENRVILDSEIDKFGIPKPILHWKKFPIDTETLKQSITEFNRWLLDNDTGRIQLKSWVFDNYNFPDGLKGGHHHMGGTRMHKNPTYGVVDSDCKVFGMQNLYMAGSSIFTTGGHNNPTLPIVQFSLRLVDHLSK